MKSKNILILADDDAGHVALVKRNLRRAGIENPILRFEDGQQVLDHFASLKIDPQSPIGYLLLLDIRMPKVDGIEVLRRLKQEGSWRELPVIMLTTTDDPREVARCHAMGCNSYIVKPVEGDQFVEAIRRLGLYLSIVEVPVLTAGAA